MKLYHVDRSRSLENGKMIELFDLSSFGTIGLFDDNAFSHHGINYLFQFDRQCRPNNDHWGSVLWEMILESIRLKKFSHFPTRMKCMFAVKSEQEAISWATKHVSSDQTSFGIAEIETDQVMEFDAQWMTVKGSKDHLNVFDVRSLGYLLKNAEFYWSQSITDTPEMECLVPLPCKITNYIICNISR